MCSTAQSSKYGFVLIMIAAGGPRYESTCNTGHPLKTMDVLPGG